MVSEIRRAPSFYGAAADLFLTRDEEVLCESGAGTGKSFAVMYYAHYCADRYPKSRILFVRGTRKSMTESVLVDFENEILWTGHPAIHGTAGRDHRDTYKYPNGSEIILAGMDNVDRIMSAQYDLICVYEATEITLHDWEQLISRLRNGKMPYQQIIADCNPKAQSHWLFQRSRRGDMKILRFLHEDNPRWADHDEEGNFLDFTREGTRYLSMLDRLSGARYKRLRLHQWVAEEGLVYPMFDPTIHIISRSDVPQLRWYFGAMDFGFSKPGCIQVWGVDSDDRIYRVVEVYRSARSIEWWAEIVAELNAEFALKRLVCDSARPDDIAVLNDRICLRSSDPIAIKADKAMTMGIEQVRAALQPDGLGLPRLYLVEGANRYGYETDEYGNKALVWGTEQEIESYVFHLRASGQIEETPDPTCEDHGLDTLRYAVAWKWKKNLQDPIQIRKYRKGTMGDILEHRKVLEASKGPWVDPEDYWVSREGKISRVDPDAWY